MSTQPRHKNPLIAFAPGLLPILGEAERTGLLAALRDDQARDGATADVLSARCRLHPRATKLVLDALTALGLCTRDGDSYRSAALFDETLPWSHLGRFLESGEVLPSIDDRAERGRGYARVVHHLGTRFADSAAVLAAHLPPAAVVLDVGAGSGVWSLSMARVYDAIGCTVIGLDLPEVVPRFAALAQEMGVAHRAVALTGDWNEVAPPGDVDRVVFGNVLHLESPADARRLVERFARFVKPGGDIVIVDAFAGAASFSGHDYGGEIAVACYALHLALRTERGGVHALDDVRAWCAGAGFANAQLIHRDVLHLPHAIVARRSLPETSPAVPSR